MQSSPLSSGSARKPGSNRQLSQLAQAMRKDNPELESNLGNYPQADSTQDLSAFRDALAQSGGNFPDSDDPTEQQQLLQQQQEEVKAKAEKNRRRKKLHDQINPVDQTDVFNRRKTQVQQEIEQLRQELIAFAGEVAKLRKEVDITLRQNMAVDPGENGIYWKNFLHQLRQWIKMLRQQVKQGGTWMTQMNSKKGKKRKKSKGPGLEMSGAGHEKASTVMDMLENSERNSAYSGG